MKTPTVLCWLPLPTTSNPSAIRREDQQVGRRFGEIDENHCCFFSASGPTGRVENLSRGGFLPGWLEPFCAGYQDVENKLEQDE